MADYGVPPNPPYVFPWFLSRPGLFRRSLFLRRGEVLVDIARCRAYALIGHAAAVFRQRRAGVEQRQFGDGGGVVAAEATERREAQPARADVPAEFDALLVVRGHQRAAFE